MKKILSALLIIAMLFSLTGCQLLTDNIADGKEALEESLRESLEAAQKAAEDKAAKEKAQENEESSEISKASESSDASDPSEETSQSSDGSPSPIESESSEASDGSNQESEPEELSALDKASEIYRPYALAATTIAHPDGISDEDYEAACALFEASDNYSFADLFMYDPSDVTILVIDLDINGTYEMVILKNDDTNIVCTLYTLVDDVPCCVFTSWARNRYYFTTDGFIYHEGSSGAMDSVSQLLYFDGISVNVLEEVRSESYHIDDSGNVVEEMRFVHTYQGIETELTYDQFAEYLDVMMSRDILSYEDASSFTPAHPETYVSIIQNLR